MTFAEFIHLTEPGIESTDIDSLIYHKDLLLHRFEEYLITGGFPLSINLFFTRGHISSYVYQLYLSWIEGDIGRAGKLERNLYQIMSRAPAQISTGISWYKLSREVSIASHATVQEYIEILERMCCGLFRLLTCRRNCRCTEKTRNSIFKTRLFFTVFLQKTMG